MTTQSFLFEIGTEELPAKNLNILAQQLLLQVKSALSKHQLSFGADTVCYATPRRLAIFIPDCQLQQADQRIERKGPKLAQAFLSDGQPSPAALGFAKSCGVSVEQLANDGECLIFNSQQTGKETLALLPEILAQAINHLPIARPMRWNSEPYAFARPVKWLLALLGTNVVPMELFGIKADRLSFGHRFLAPQAISFDQADRCGYEQRLKAAKVVASFDERQHIIQQQLIEQAQAQHGHIVADEALLQEVTGLVEWPVALTVAFNQGFLQLPKEALIASMQNHQKCFAVENEHHQLQPLFITVANIEGGSRVIAGNAKVMHARLSDAEFFYHSDLKIPLSQYQSTLAHMTFQQRLGSMWSKVEAMAAFMAGLAPQLALDDALARQSAGLAKSDLCTQMVGEFPELQGIMGRAYSKAQGVEEGVSIALYEQYLPRFAGDALPTTALGSALALADRLLNLTGIFGIGQIPSGDKDPFALRRAALGVIRILVHLPKRLSLSTLLHLAIASWQQQQVHLADDTLAQVQAFILERLRHFWLEQSGFQTFATENLSAAIDAVLSRQPEDLQDAKARLLALLNVQHLAEAAALASSHKRVNNFLSKRGQGASNAAIDSALFEKVSEQKLHTQIEQIEAAVQPLLTAHDYPAVLQQLALLKQPVDAFFTEVMVLVEDEAVRDNRLALLQRLQALLNSVADLSLL